MIRKLVTYCSLTKSHQKFMVYVSQVKIDKVETLTYIQMSTILNEQLIEFYQNLKAFQIRYRYYKTIYIKQNNICRTTFLLLSIVCVNIIVIVIIIIFKFANGKHKYEDIIQIIYTLKVVLKQLILPHYSYSY